MNIWRWRVDLETFCSVSFLYILSCSEIHAWVFVVIGVWSLVFRIDGACRVFYGW